MKPRKHLLLTGLSLLSTAFLAAEAVAEPTSLKREFRPLMAKSVKISPASRLGSGRVSEGDLLTREGWGFFDLRKWDSAADRFLSALESSPGNVSAIEGLAMSLYQSGDYGSAVRLGEELATAMPRIRFILAETALADVREMVERSELDSARAFLAHFPVTDPAYLPAHDLLEIAAPLDREKEKSDSLSPESAVLAGK